MDDRLLRREAFYINGRWQRPSHAELSPVVSPATEAVIGHVPLGTADDIDAAIAAARDAFEDGPWPRMGPAERAAALGRVAELMRERESDFAEVNTEEMGCPISYARGTQRGVAPVFDYYAELARNFEFEREVVSGEYAAVVTGVPVSPASCALGS